jgi:hypothetical protein
VVVSIKVKWLVPRLAMPLDELDELELEELDELELDELDELEELELELEELELEELELDELEPDAPVVAPPQAVTVTTTARNTAIMRPIRNRLLIS